MKLILAFIAIITAVPVSASEMEFFWGEEVVKTIGLKEMSDGTLKFKEKEQTLKKESVYNPFRKYTRVYEGYDFIELMDNVYGKKWREAEIVRFHALDGFVQSAPVKKMLERTGEHLGVLAIGEEGKKNFVEFEKNGKMVNPGPFYLVWTKFDGRNVANYSDHLKWPYQLKRITVVDVKK